MVDLLSLEEVEDVGLDRRIDLKVGTKVKKTSLQVNGILNEGDDRVIRRSECVLQCELSSMIKKRRSWQLCRLKYDLAPRSYAQATDLP